MHWNWEVNIGNVLTAAGLLLGFLVAHVQNIRKLEQIVTKVNLMYHWFEKRIINGQD